MFLNIDAVVAGRVEDSGEVTFWTSEGGIDVLDEIARRAWLSGARLYAVRQVDMPADSDVVGTLRFAPGM